MIFHVTQYDHFRMIRVFSETATRKRQHAMAALFGVAALLVVLATHGLVMDDSMHNDSAAQCVAATADASPARLCTPLSSVLAESERPGLDLRAIRPQDVSRPASPELQSRHGPSDLQVFRI